MVASELVGGRKRISTARLPSEGKKDLFIHSDVAKQSPSKLDVRYQVYGFCLPDRLLQQTVQAVVVRSEVTPNGARHAKFSLGRRNGRPSRGGRFCPSSWGGLSHPAEDLSILLRGSADEQVSRSPRSSKRSQKPSVQA